MTKDEALKITIELMERFLEYDGISSSDYIDVLDACKEALAQPLTRDWKETIDERIAKDDAFKQALEQPEQEPDYWLGYRLQAHDEKPFEGATPLYTHPAPSWQGLSDDEILIICAKMAAKLPNKEIDLIFARAIEQALKEKNT